MKVDAKSKCLVKTKWVVKGKDSAAHPKCLMDMQCTAAGDALKPPRKALTGEESGEAPWAALAGAVRVGGECPGPADALCLSRCLAQMSVMVGLRLLHTSLESIANPEDPECESEGWVLENSLKDTFKSALENLKKLGKFNQVEAGAEGAEGEEGGKTPAITTVSWAAHWGGLFLRENNTNWELWIYLHFKSYVPTIRIHISTHARFCTWEDTT